MFSVGDPVKTPYGEGVVTDLRHEQLVIQPTTWNMAGGQKATLYLGINDVKPLFKVGDSVRTLFGVGKITEIRTEGVPYVVQLNRWQLASAKSPVLYLAEHSLKREPAAEESSKPPEVWFAAPWPFILCRFSCDMFTSAPCIREKDLRRKVCDCKS